MPKIDMREVPHQIGRDTLASLISSAGSALPRFPQVASGLPTHQRNWSMATIMLGIALSCLDCTVVPLALPEMAPDLDPTASSALRIVFAHQFAERAATARLGYKRIYLAGVIVFRVASALASASILRCSQLRGPPEASAPPASCRQRCVARRARQVP